MSVRIGIGAGSTMARAGRATFLAYLETLETQGWDSIWFSDRIVGPAWVVDPIVAMAMTAAHTQRLRFGTSVLLMSMRSPVAAARALATIDNLSEGRLILGVGVGQESPLEYEAMGVAKRERGQRLDEAIRIMRRLWTEDKVTYESEFLKLTDTCILPKPAQADLPIWIGGRTEAAFRRTGRLGDGWLPTQVTPEDCERGIARIKEHAAEAGRQLEEDHYGIQLGCYLVERGPIPEKASSFLLSRRSDVGPEQLHLLGTPDQVIARIREYIDAGITKFVFNPACSADDMFEQLQFQADALVTPFHTKQVA